jgi:hypothetical protein
MDICEASMNHADFFWMCYKCLCYSLQVQCVTFVDGERFELESESFEDNEDKIWKYNILKIKWKNFKKIKYYKFNMFFNYS